MSARNQADDRIAQALGELGLAEADSGQLATLARESTRAEISSGTSISSPEDAALLHVVDSLAVFQTNWLENAQQIADIGTGLGFPGLVIAAILPQAQVTLVDSARKKVDAALALARHAGLTNVDAVWGRAEELGAVGSPHRTAFDVVTARALAPLGVLAEYAAPLLRENGAIVAWKSDPDDQERRDGDAAAALLGMSSFEQRATGLVGDAITRSLWRATKLQPTSEDFPRRPGRAARTPLSAAD